MYEHDATSSTNSSASGGESGLPVMLFIHGGCNKYGEGSGLPMENLVALAGDVVVVAFNYRLGVFGWMGGKEIAATTPDNSSGNFGTQDQRAAMVWVQKNIAQFGGDPSRVLLFGESAGASAVSAHLVSEKSRGLFAAAAMESGAFAHWNSIPLEGAQLLYNDVATAHGCADLDCLKAVEFEQLYKSTLYTPSPCKYHQSYAPVVDQVEFKAQIWELAKSGAGSVRDVPILMGSNRDEGAMFIWKLQRNATYDEFAKCLPRGI